MKILAVDTTSDILSLAITDGRRVWKRRVAAKGRHEELLPRETDRLLKRAGWKLRDIGLVTAASGPGSFTGIRVGLTFASVLANTINRPAVAVSRFEAEAARVIENLNIDAHSSPSRRRGPGLGSCPRKHFRGQLSRKMLPGRLRGNDLNGEGLIGVVLPSRENEIFCQFFRYVRGTLREHRPPQWVKLSDWPKVFRAGAWGKEILLVGPAAREAAKLLGPIGSSVKIRDDDTFDAEWLIAPALERLARGTAGDFAPLYLKPAYYERRGR